MPGRSVQSDGSFNPGNTTENWQPCFGLINLNSNGEQMDAGQRRKVLVVIMALMMGAAGGCSTSNQSEAPPSSVKPPHLFWVFVGTYTKTISKGIYLLKLDTDTGALSPPTLAAQITDPNFLVAGRGNRFLFTVGHASDGKTSVVDAFAMDARTGKLTFLNQQPSGGQGATHLDVDRAGTTTVVANYSSGQVSVLPIAPDGTLGPPSQVIQHTGSSVDPQRQQHAFPHACNFDPTGRFVLVPDLGTDKVYTYRFDASDHKLTPGDPAAVVVAPGTGPRHMAFHPNGRFAYVVGEMGGTAMVFAYDSQHGSLRPLQTISTLPPDYKGQNTTAEVQVLPSGKFLFVSNRGPNDIAIFSIEDDGARLVLKGFQSTLGKGPRYIGVDPTGRFLLAANQYSDSVILYRIDPQTGALTPTGASVQVGIPVSLLFVPVGG
jgi:6-phosphogluconolactonase